MAKENQEKKAGKKAEEEPKEEGNKARKPRERAEGKREEKKPSPKKEASGKEKEVGKTEEADRDHVVLKVSPDFRRRRRGGRRGRRREEEEKIWYPKTELGKEVIAGKYKDIFDLLDKKKVILEPEIVDYLVPELKKELIYIGGTPGKGGGARRTPTRMTARMHKSGRRFKLTALMAVGNGNGILGIGKAISGEHMLAIEKASQQAKLNIINVRRGCGSWECNCGGDHSIPFKTEAKVGSVRISFHPTPTGVGIVADSETKKILKLAGIRDVWVKTHGTTSTRMNLAMAVFKALKNLGMTKGDV